jgi:hypothetical protein
LADIHMTMALLAGMAILAGAILGTRFKVFVLVPAIVVGSAASIGASLAEGDGPWAIVLAAFLTVIALQIGYLGGSALGFVVSARRARKNSAAFADATQRVSRPA